MSGPEQQQQQQNLDSSYFPPKSLEPPPPLLMDVDLFDFDAPWPLDQISHVSSNPMSPFLFSSYEQPCSPLWAFSDDGYDEKAAGSCTLSSFSGGLRLSEYPRFVSLSTDPASENPKSNDDRIKPNIEPTPKNSNGVCIIKERMTRALRYFKESTEQHVLAQVWAPVMSGNRFVLTTSGQPFVLDPHSNGLNQYRMASLRYMFSVDGDSEGELGLPGRVYQKKLPEWTPNVQYYSSKEYSRLDHALRYNVRGTLALPVFEPPGKSCVGVLEIILTSQKINYASEVDKVCKALEAVNLKSSDVLEHPKTQIPNKGRYNALAEILQILTVICETHKLPLAQTWVPCKHRSILANGGGPKKSCSSFDGSCSGRVCMSTSDVAFYITDPRVYEFREACAEHHLQSGQGVAGRAFSSHASCFCSDITQFSKTEYPLVHYARLFGLASCFAICLQSTHTGSDDYILEFFLPPNISESSVQQTLLDKLLVTMKQHLKSFTIAFQQEFEDKRSIEIIKASHPAKSSLELDIISNDKGNVLDMGRIRIQKDASCSEKKQVKKAFEKKRGKAEKSISFEVLKQYFSGSLKDAAKSLGVCPTTMKRICRQHGISRWPSRKINKVNRSLTKLKRVIESVHCTDGAFGLSWPAGNQSGQPISPQPGEKIASPPSCGTPDSRISTPNGRIRDQNGFLQESSKGSVKCKTRSGSREESVGSPTSHVSCQRSPENDITVDHPVRMRDSIEVTNQPLNVSDATKTPSSNFTPKQSIPIPNSNVLQETAMMVTVKATYRDDIIRFKIPFNSSILEWREEVAKRLKLEGGIFEIKYLDDDHEWVLLACNADLQECKDISRLMGSNMIRLSIHDTIECCGSSCESTIGRL